MTSKVAGMYFFQDFFTRQKKRAFEPVLISDGNIDIQSEFLE